MIWVFAILIVLVMGGVAVVAAGRGEPMSTAYDDRPDALVPAERPLAGEDLKRVRFSLAFRGYRMAEVDALLERLAAQLSPEPAASPADAAEAPVDESVQEPVRQEAAADSGDGAAL